MEYGWVYHPSRCTFQPFAAQLGNDLGNAKKEVAVLDTLPEEGGTIMCLRWMKWGDPLRGYDQAVNRTVVGALIVAQVDEERNIYRRIGWVEVVDTPFFDEESKTITLI